MIFIRLIPALHKPLFINSFLYLPMHQTLMIAIDNSYYSQNQDYFPTRFIAQKKVVESLIYDTIQQSPENTVGFAPLVSCAYNICTPTNDTHRLITHLAKLDLFDLHDPNLVVEACLRALLNKMGKRVFLLFIGSRMDITDSILNMINSEVTVYIVCFGEGAAVLDRLREKVNPQCFDHVYIQRSADFYAETMNLFGKSGHNYDDDPDLALALKLSMQDQ